MDLSAAYAPLLQPGTASVLSVLAGTSAGLTGRTVAQLAGLSHAGAAKILTRFVAHGMVLVEPVGAANSYRLNREHLLVGPAMELVGALDRLDAQLAATLDAWATPCLGCALFGSAARRDGSAGSDLDVLVLRPDTVALDDPIWRAQLDQTATRVEQWTGNPVSWVEFDAATFERMIAAGDPLVAELRRDAHWLREPTSAIQAGLTRRARPA